MTPEQTRQFNEMIKKVDEIFSWMNEKKKQQLALPLDVGSINVLNEAFRTKYFDVVKTRELFLKPGFSVDPSQVGQIVLHGASGSRVIKVFLNSTVRTVTTT